MAVNIQKGSTIFLYIVELSSNFLTKALKRRSFIQFLDVTNALEFFKQYLGKRIKYGKGD